MSRVAFSDIFDGEEKFFVFQDNRSNFWYYDVTINTTLSYRNITLKKGTTFERIYMKIDIDSFDTDTSEAEAIVIFSNYMDHDTSIGSTPLRSTSYRWNISIPLTIIYLETDRMFPLNLCNDYCETDEEDSDEDIDK